MKLLTATPEVISAGTYNLKMIMTTGDARIQYESHSDGEGFTDSSESVKAADFEGTIKLPKGRVQSLITGDATVYLNLINY